MIVAGFFPRTVRSAPREPVLRAEVMSLPGLGGVAEPAMPQPGAADAHARAADLHAGTSHPDAGTRLRSGAGCDADARAG